LAGEIYSEFEIMPDLVEGHNGIFKVAIDGDVVYTNRSQCGQFPSADEIIQKVEAYGGRRVRWPESASTTPHSQAPATGSATCCPGAESCCGATCSEGVACPLGQNPNFAPSPETAQRLTIDFLYLDLSECGRCIRSDAGLDEAVAEVRPVLASLGVQLAVNKIHVQTESQARNLRFASSPTIRINGMDIAQEFRESPCEDCGDLCGDQVTCREWLYNGKTYSTPPKPLIVDAILRSLYTETPPTPEPFEDVPENLKRFFRGSRASETM
jgi:hypothetical protein